MDVATFRDIIIIIWGIIGIIFLIAVGILAFLLYSKVSNILNQTKEITTKAKVLADYATREVVEPLIGLSVLVHSVTEGAQQVQRMFTGQRGGDGAGGKK
jgi:hypothetical protein